MIQTRRPVGHIKPYSNARKREETRGLQSSDIRASILLSILKVVLLGEGLVQRNRVEVTPSQGFMDLQTHRVLSGKLLYFSVGPSMVT